MSTKNISYYEFVESFLRITDKNYIDNLNEQEKLYIGKPMPMTNEQLEKYGSLIIEVSKQVARYVKKNYPTSYTVEDLSGFNIDIFMNKCGGVVHNAQHDLNYLTNVLRKYGKKSSLLVMKESILNSLQNTNQDGKEFSLANRYVYEQEKDNKYKKDAADILQKVNFTKKEIKLLTLMKEQLENNDELDYEDISIQLSYPKEKVLSLVKDIQTKIVNK